MGIVTQGSISECRYFLILTNDLDYAETTELHALLDEVGRMLNSYTQKVLS
jgi:four helix bundle protein